ncbi:hypothetical protein B7494_g3569 [Chlorociboria aeruginascens]|nr:hypothetical protein B7494_g3569 [Chlorociboria aeruginascens]
MSWIGFGFGLRVLDDGGCTARLNGGWLLGWLLDMGLDLTRGEVEGLEYGRRNGMFRRDHGRIRADVGDIEVEVEVDVDVDIDVGVGWKRK